VLAVLGAWARGRKERRWGRGRRVVVAQSCLGRCFGVRHRGGGGGGSVRGGGTGEEGTLCGGYRVVSTRSPVERGSAVPGAEPLKMMKGYK